MLSLYLQEYDSRNLRDLAELCRDSFMLDWEARVEACATAPDDLLEQVKRADIPALFIMEDARREHLDQAVARIREQNGLHYLILRLYSVFDAIHIRPPFYRASGFLVAPIDKDILTRLLDGVYHDFSSMSTEYGGFFSLKVRGTVYRIPYRKILFFESSGKKILARTSAQEYEFYDSLEDISRDAPEFFLRAHRSFCVNMHRVNTVNFSEKTITMFDGSVIPFSRTFKPELSKAMEDRRMSRN